MAPQHLVIYLPDKTCVLTGTADSDDCVILPPNPKQDYELLINPRSGKEQIYSESLSIVKSATCAALQLCCM